MISKSPSKTSEQLIKNKNAHKKEKTIQKEGKYISTEPKKKEFYYKGKNIHTNLME